MKVSLSLPDDDITFVDTLAGQVGTSRSAIVHDAITALRSRDLAADYAAAFLEWEQHAAVWEPVVGDGLAE